MENTNAAKTTLFGIIGIAGSYLSKLFGGWDMVLEILLIFMIVDYISGLIVAGVFKKSKKTETGALESKAGWKGLCRKGMTLLYVLIAAQVDRIAGTDVVRNAVAIGFMCNEGLSLIENGGLMGVPYPQKFKEAIDLLNSKGSDTNVN